MKTIAVCGLSLFTVFIVSCGKGPTSPSQGNGANMIQIKGTFAGAAGSAALARNGTHGMNRVSSIDPSTVTGVIVFSGTSGFNVCGVAEGSFSVSADRSRPAGLVFVDSAGRNLGYLSLGNGLESIPLNKVDSGVTTIDLQTLAATGSIVEPGHNPIGSEISLTGKDLTSYIFSNGVLGSVLKSPDVDGDGIVDAVSGRMYVYQMRYDIRAGSFGSGLTPTIADPIVISGYMFTIRVLDPDGNYPATVSVAGPAGSGLESAASWLVIGDGSSPRDYLLPGMSNPTIPPEGQYIITYKTRSLTFNLPSQTEITRCVAVPVPTFFLNADSTINRVEWQYLASDGSSTIDPKAFISEMGLEIYLTVPNQVEPVQYYSPVHLPPEPAEHLFSDQTIKWDRVAGVATNYIDVFGNCIMIYWSRL